MSSISTQLLVGHLGLGEQHVHVAGHPAGDRVDRVVDLDAALAEHVDELAQRVLRLGDRQAVAGHDDHPVGVRRAGSRRPRARRSCTGRSQASPAPSVEPPLSAPNRMLATERPIARAISRVRNVPEAPTRVPATSSSDVGQHVAAGGDGEAGERVEQRDHDRYVGAADRQHQQHADQQAEQAEHDRRSTSAGRSPASTASTTAASSAAPNSDRQAREDHRPRGHQVLQLGEGDQRAGEGDRADHDRERRRGEVEPAVVAAGVDDARGARAARPARPRRRRRR